MAYSSLPVGQLLTESDAQSQVMNAEVKDGKTWDSDVYSDSGHDSELNVVQPANDVSAFELPRSSSLEDVPIRPGIHSGSEGMPCSFEELIDMKLQCTESKTTTKHGSSNGAMASALSQSHEHTSPAPVDSPAPHLTLLHAKHDKLRSSALSQTGTAGTLHERSLEEQGVGSHQDMEDKELQEFEEFERFVQLELEMGLQERHLLAQTNSSPPLFDMTSQSTSPSARTSPSVVDKASELKDPRSHSRLSDTKTSETNKPVPQETWGDNESWDPPEPPDPMETTQPPPTSSLVANLFHPRTSSAPSISKQRHQKDKQRSNQKNVPGSEILSAEKIQELEDELARYRAENERVQRLRTSHQRELQKLRQEQAAFEEHRAAEAERFKAWQEAEVKKLQKSKRMVDKQLRNNATHTERSKERQELEVCREEIESLRKEGVQKETKWQLAVERLKQRVNSQAKQIEELKEELALSEQLRMEAEDQAHGLERRIEQDAVVRVKPSQIPQPMTGSRLSSKASPSTTISNERPCQDVEMQRREGSDTPLPTEDEVTTTGIPRPKGGNRKVEQVLEDGRRVVLYSNGTRKEIFPEGDSVIHFTNGDTKQICADQRVVYYYAEAQITQITYLDGLEEFEFVDGQRERHFPDGRQEVIFSDGTLKFISANGHEETHFTDGTVEVS